LQAYLLIDGKGNRIDEGPTKIVSVKNKPDPTVINGVSCMFCHARGMIDKADQVRGHVDKNRSAFSETDVKTILALYPPESEMKSWLTRDAERFSQGRGGHGREAERHRADRGAGGPLRGGTGPGPGRGRAGLAGERFLARPGP
jgi:hypothetical protein